VGDEIGPGYIHYYMGRDPSNEEVAASVKKAFTGFL
jgi:hypothetical protein